MEISYLSISSINPEMGDKIISEKEKLFIEIHQHLMEDVHPSNFLNEISHRKLFQQSPFSMLYQLKSTMQSPVHHPEGSAWNHTLLVVDEAAKRRVKSRNPEAFMWAALLHDIGKPDTTRSHKGKITAYSHDTAGVPLAKEFLEYFKSREEFVEQVINLVKYHMHLLYVLKDLPFGNVEMMKKKVDIHELALLGLCDRLGRTNADQNEEENNVLLFMTKIKNKGLGGIHMAKNKDNKTKASKKNNNNTSLVDTHTSDKTENRNNTNKVK